MLFWNKIIRAAMVTAAGLLVGGVSAAMRVASASEAVSRPATASATQPAKELLLDLGNLGAKKVTMQLVLVPAGKFVMGSPATETDPEHARPKNEVQHEVTISKAFYMGVTEVTQTQYEAVMGKNPSKFKGPTQPVDLVSWDEAVEFCKRVSIKTGKTVCLPTEAQWEYAARAGSKARYSFGDRDADLGDYAWYIANSLDRATGLRTTHPVGLKKPNAWGLYDMQGNVWEWCADWYAANYGGKDKDLDPTGPATGSIRVLRGGSWTYCSFGSRLAGRGRIGPKGEYDVNGGGFRVTAVGAGELTGPASRPTTAASGASGPSR